jgi:hypothetical protein
MQTGFGHGHHALRRTRGGHHTSEDVERGQNRPARPSDEPALQRTEPARPHEPDGEVIAEPGRRSISEES